MGHKWKPSKAQKREFAIRMQNPEESAAYEQRKSEKSEKRRSESKFDYEKAGGYYIPTKFQHDSAFKFLTDNVNLTTEQETALNNVMFGFSCQEKIHHDSIHIVNELIRSNIP